MTAFDSKVREGPPGGCGLNDKEPGLGRIRVESILGGGKGLQH